MQMQRPPALQYCNMYKTYKTSAVPRPVGRWKAGESRFVLGPARDGCRRNGQTITQCAVSQAPKKMKLNVQLTQSDVN